MKPKLKDVSPYILTAAMHGKTVPNSYEQCPQGDKDIHTKYLYLFFYRIRKGEGFWMQKKKIVVPQELKIGPLKAGLKTHPFFLPI